MKTLLSLALVTILGLSTPVYARSSWEKQVIHQKTDVYTYHKHRYQLKDYPYYTLVDINHDGTKEVLLSNQKEDKNGYMNVVDQPTEVLLLANVNGKTKILKRFTYGNLFYFSYRPSQKALGFWTRMSGQTNSKVYTFDGQKLKIKYTLDYYSPNHDEKTDGMNKTDHYYLNNKRVNKKTFTQSFNKYVSDRYMMHFTKR